ncbi:MAG: SusC/RagA family TonB-linked outer membrane protein [Gemmatimonadota bacterium]|nr:SusC/RagA family TonB-linked outer membrane protein [Gemmatimonadota bacterium]
MLAALLITAGAAPSVAAQEGTVSGVVVTQGTERPVSGAQVSVQGTNRTTSTDPSGRFRLTGLSGAQVTLTVSRLGYGGATRTAAVGATDVRISLSEAAVALDALVVTGTAGGEQRRAIGNVVTQIDAATAVETGPISSVQNLINARAPGVVIMPGTGQVGGGSKIRIRGSSSLSLSNEPLLYVDGIRVDNAQSTGPAVQAFGSSIINRLNDFNPDDIESIEIIKGPAAATLYGTEASNGVIQIITKKGRIGAPVFGVTVRQGANWFANDEGRVWTNYWRNPTTNEVESLNLVTSERERGTPLFQAGRLQGYNLNLSGGSQGVRYYLGGDFDRERGVEPNNSLNRYSGRANVSIYPSDKIDVVGSMGYVAGRTNLSCEAGCGGATWGSFYSTPANLEQNLPAGAPPRRGFRSFTTEAYYASEDFQDLGRFTGSVQLSHRPAEWFSQRLSFGTDETREDNQSITERSEILQIFAPGSTGGKTVSRRDVSYNTLDYSGTFQFSPLAGLSSNTSVGTQYYRRFTKFITATGSEFVVPNLRAISATANRNAFETYVENTTVGVFAQQQFGWQDRLFVTAALRADDNSAFGENFDLVYYPKLSASWVVSEEPFWRVPALNTLKLRAAYGVAGQQPTAFASLRTFGAVVGPDGSGTVTPRDAGNPNLGPERSSEIELGFDAGLFQDRMGVEFTLYNARTRDAILTRPAAPSQGFPGSQFVNLGELRNRGAELLVRGTPVQRRNVGWDVSMSFATNDSEVTDLGDNDALVESAAFGVEHRLGHPVGSWFHVRVVDAQLDANGRFIRESMMCDGGPQNGGQPVPCWTGNNVTAPRVFLGRTTPRYEGAFNSNLTLLNRLRIGTLIDYKAGHSKWDHNMRVRCSLFNVCRENIFPLEYDPVTISAYQNADRFGAQYINDASFAKLRELSATYTVPDDWSRRLGASRASLTLAGRNLYTWTRWTGMEPEAMFLGGARGGFVQIEQNNLPQLTQFVTTINLNF